MPTFTATVDSAQFPGTFLGQVDLAATSIVFSATGQYSWQTASHLWAQPEGGYATLAFPEFPPTYNPAAVTDNFELFLPPFPSSFLQWVAYDVSPAVCVPLCTMVLAVPHGSGFPYLGTSATQITTATGPLFRINRGPTTVTVGSGPGEIPAGYDLWAFTNQIQDFWRTVTAGTISVTAIVTDATPPSSPPPAPTGLVWSAGQCEGNQISLAWTPTASVPAVTSYTAIRFSVVGGSIFSDTRVTFSVPASMMPAYVDATVQPGQEYQYTVTATNSAGTSDQSAPLLVTPCPVPVPQVPWVALPPPLAPSILLGWHKEPCPCGDDS